MIAVTSVERPPDRDGYRDLVRKLQGAQKSAVGAPAYSRFVNRPLGRRFAAMGHLLGATPNQVTALSALFSLTGILLVALVRPAWWTGLIVGVCLILGYALDSADGQLARLRGKGGVSGEWLDHVVDAAKISALHLAVLVGAYRFLELPQGWLVVPVLFTVVANVTFFGMILRDLLAARHVARTGVDLPRQAPSTVRSLLVLPTDYGLLCLVFLLWGVPAVFGPAYLFIFLASSGFLALALVKWFRDMERLDRS